MNMVGQGGEVMWWYDMKQSEVIWGYEVQQEYEARKGYKARQGESVLEKKVQSNQAKVTC